MNARWKAATAAFRAYGKQQSIAEPESVPPARRPRVTARPTQADAAAETMPISADTLPPTLASLQAKNPTPDADADDLSRNICHQSPTTPTDIVDTAAVLSQQPASGLRSRSFSSSPTRTFTFLNPATDDVPTEVLEEPTDVPATDVTVTMILGGTTNCDSARGPPVTTQAVLVGHEAAVGTGAMAPAPSVQGARRKPTSASRGDVSGLPIEAVPGPQAAQAGPAAPAEYLPIRWCEQLVFRTRGSELPSGWMRHKLKRRRDWEQHFVLGMGHRVYHQINDEMGRWSSMAGIRRRSKLGEWLQQPIAAWPQQWGVLCKYVEHKVTVFFQLRHIVDRWARYPQRDLPGDNAMYYAFALAAETKPDCSNWCRSDGRPNEAYIGSSWHVLWTASAVGNCSLESFRNPADAFGSSVGLQCDQVWKRAKSDARPANVFGDGLFYRIIFHIEISEECMCKGVRTSGKLIVPCNAVWMRGMWVLANTNVQDVALACVCALKNRIRVTQASTAPISLTHHTANTRSGRGAAVLHVDAPTRSTASWVLNSDSASWSIYHQGVTGGVRDPVTGAR
jgi:hypothetical protein